MPRQQHGEVLTVGSMRLARQSLERQIAGMSAAAIVAAGEPSGPVSLQDFGYLFPALQNDPNALLPESPDTVERLKALGRTMQDTFNNSGDSNVPAAYTYLGQFVDHDITLEAVSAPLPRLLDPGLEPLPVVTIKAILRNGRTSPLDLDSLYGFPAPTDGDKMVVNRVTPLNNPNPSTARPDGKDDFNDLPSLPRAAVFEHDRAALIGDGRNDENLAVAQLHVAFLRAHNALVAQGNNFDDAQRILRQHYQHIVLHDYLPRIADPDVVERVLKYGPRFYQAMNEPFFMPLEFSVAAFRFGHSMIRARYNFNSNFPGATLVQLFTFTALSGQVGGFDTLPENWIVQWEGLLDGPGSRARRFDTKLVEPLFDLPGIQGETSDPNAPDAEKAGGRLAVRNPLRGYLLRMPTGQAVAAAIGESPLTADEIVAAAVGPEGAPWIDAGLDFIRDRLDDALEPLVRNLSGKLQWDEMKENGILASRNAQGATRIVLKHLHQILEDDPTVEIHIAAYSAGSIFMAPLIQLLATPGAIEDGPMANKSGFGHKIASCTLWAPAMTIDLFKRSYLPVIEQEKIDRFGLYTLTDKAEQDDHCANIYHKSLLYLVSNALEERFRIPWYQPEGEPILGMATFVEDDEKLKALFVGPQADWVQAPNTAEGIRASRATSHGGFDNDTETLESTLKRILHK